MGIQLITIARVRKGQNQIERIITKIFAIYRKEMKFVFDPINRRKKYLIHIYVII